MLHDQDERLQGACNQQSLAPCKPITALSVSRLCVHWQLAEPAALKKSKRPKIAVQVERNGDSSSVADTGRRKPTCCAFAVFDELNRRLRRAWIAHL